LFNRQLFDFRTCADGTRYNSCSKDKPNYCSNGEIIEKASLCNCPENYVVRGENCKEDKRCYDGTLNDECSARKPYFCRNGSMILRPVTCGCPEGEVASAGDCIKKN
jgi:hypothetical protein